MRRVLLLPIAVAAVLVAGCGGGQQSEGSGAAQEEGGQAGGRETTADMEGERSQVSRFQEPVYGSSFVSPLAEIFGDDSMG